MIRFLRDAGAFKKGMERELGLLEAGFLGAGDAIRIPGPESLPTNNGIVQWQFDPKTQLPVGAKGTDGSKVALPTIKYLSLEEIAAPSAAMLADTTTIYQLNVAPFTRYTSNGTALSAGSGGGASQFSSLTDATSVNLPLLNAPLATSLLDQALATAAALVVAQNKPCRVVKSHAEYEAAHDYFETLPWGGRIEFFEGLSEFVCDENIGGLYANSAKVSVAGARTRINHEAIVRGTARGAMTDGTLHAAGTTTIKLANAGTGSIKPGNLVMIIGPQNDITTYWVKQGVADVAGGGTLTLRVPLQKAIPASGCQVVIMAAPGLTVDFVNDIAAGEGARNSKASQYGGMIFHGPGRRSWGSRSVYVSGSQAGKAPRPTFYSIMCSYSEAGFGGRNVFFLLNSFAPEVYQCKYGLWQEAGSDAGENISLYGGPIHFCDCAIRNDEPSAGIYIYSQSLNHNYQILLVRSSANITLISPHIENRAKNPDTDPGNYFLDASGRVVTFTGSVSGSVLTVTALTGTIFAGMGLAGPVYLKPGVTVLPLGSNGTTGTGGTGTYALSEAIETIPSQALTLGDGDPRAPLPGFDAPFDIAGDSNINCGYGGTKDINTDGNSAGPYGYEVLVRTRDPGSRLKFIDMMGVNLMNYANQLWDGPGWVEAGFHVKHSGDPLMPTRTTSDQRDNLVDDPAYTRVANLASGQLGATAGLQQNWFVSLDANGLQAASRLNGTNVDLSIVKPAGGVTANITDGTIAAGTRTLTVNAIANGTSVALGQELTFNLSSGPVTVYVSDFLTGTGGTGTYQLSATIAEAQTNFAQTITSPGGVALFTGSIAQGARRLVVTAVAAAKIRRGMTLTGLSAVGLTIIGPLDAGAAAGGAGTYLLSGTASNTVAFTAKAMGAVIFRAMKINAKGTMSGAGGLPSARRVSLMVEAFAGKRIPWNFLTFTPATSGLAAVSQANSIRIESNYARVADAPDANGVPMVLERTNPTDAAQWTPNAAVGSWEERSLRAYNVLSVCPKRFRRAEMLVRMDTLTAVGEFYIALPGAWVWGS